MTLPAVPDAFYWTEESWGPVLRCRPLEAAAPHLFTTRQLPLTRRGDWGRLGAVLGASSVATLAQVHGRDVVIIRRGDAVPPTPPEADVLVSDNPQVALAVRAADCVPLLLADPHTGAVAAVHAGWRGTAAGAASAAVEALTREFAARPRDLIAAIGPSIGACCYEVGPELIDAFVEAGQPREQAARWFMAPPRTDRPRLDTWAANRDQLMLAGLQEENIHLSGLCTASNIEWFPSFRAEGAGAGRMAGVIRSTA
jgi:hypothetical protein